MAPSALVVLLGAVALHRAAFGVGLVLGYGAGMAAVLTAAGLVVAELSDRAQARLDDRLRWARPLRRRTPVLTAALVVLVGAGPALRSALPLYFPS